MENNSHVSKPVPAGNHLQYQWVQFYSINLFFDATKAVADFKYFISLTIQGLFETTAVQKLLCQITAIAVLIIPFRNISFVFCIILPHFYL